MFDRVPPSEPPIKQSLEQRNKVVPITNLAPVAAAFLNNYSEVISVNPRPWYNQVGPSYGSEDILFAMEAYNPQGKYLTEKDSDIPLGLSRLTQIINPDLLDSPYRETVNRSIQLNDPSWRTQMIDALIQMGYTPENIKKNPSQLFNLAINSLSATTVLAIYHRYDTFKNDINGGRQLMEIAARMSALVSDSRIHLVTEKGKGQHFLAQDLRNENDFKSQVVLSIEGMDMIARYYEHFYGINTDPTPRIQEAVTEIVRYIKTLQVSVIHIQYDNDNTFVTNKKLNEFGCHFVNHIFRHTNIVIDGAHSTPPVKNEIMKIAERTADELSNPAKLTQYINSHGAPVGPMAEAMILAGKTQSDAELRGSHDNEIKWLMNAGFHNRFQKFSQFGLTPSLSFFINKYSYTNTISRLLDEYPQTAPYTLTTAPDYAGGPNEKRMHGWGSYSELRQNYLEDLINANIPVFVACCIASFNLTQYFSEEI
jgi:hypothetical protein